MSFWKKITTEIKGNEDFSELKSSSLRDFLNGNFLSKKFLTKHYGLFALLVVLAIVYINNRYVVEGLLLQEAKLKDQLKVVKFESLVISSDLTKMSRRSYVLDYINKSGLDLVESPTPPVKIKPTNPKKDKPTVEAIDQHKSATDKINQNPSNNEEYIVE